MTKIHRQTALLLLSALAILIAGYWLLRFNGWYDEGDALRLRFAADSIIAQQKLVTDNNVYGNGYAFQVMLVALAMATGGDPASMQIVTTFWLVAFVIACFMVYRQLLADDSLALLGVVVLLMMPDFLYYMLRASHERITWTLGMLIMALWLRNNDSSRPLVAASVVPATYLLFWAMVSTNVFLASTILGTFAFALLLLLILGFALSSNERILPRSQRMVYILLTGITLVVVFLFYTYTPARTYVLTLGSLADRIAVTLFGAEEATVPSSINYLGTAWRSTSTYAGLVIFQYIVLVASFAAWIRWGWRVIHSGRRPVSSTYFILWLLYFGIGLQLAIGLLADTSGAIAGNLQVRYMAPFLIMAVAMSATWLKGIKSPQSYLSRTPTFRFLTLAVAGLSVIAALLKVTNDPMVGNFWTFYKPQEARAGAWVDENLSNARVWIDINTHKRDVLIAEQGIDWVPANRYVTFGIDPSISHFLISDLTRKKAIRYGIALPSSESQNRVYDAGDVQLFHRRPLTPFQR